MRRIIAAGAALLILAGCSSAQGGSPSTAAKASSTTSSVETTSHSPTTSSSVTSPPATTSSSSSSMAVATTEAVKEVRVTVTETKDRGLTKKQSIQKICLHFDRQMDQTGLRKILRRFDAGKDVYEDEVLAAAKAWKTMEILGPDIPTSEVSTSAFLLQGQIIGLPDADSIGGINVSFVSSFWDSLVEDCAAHNWDIS